MSNIIIGKTLLSSNTPKRGDKGILINKKYFIPFSSGSGNEFYKCTSVKTPQQVTFYRVSNAEYTVVNGDYKNSGSSYNGQPIYSYTNTTNNITYYLFYSEYSQWGITDTTDYNGDFVFYSDCFYTSDDSNVTGEWWVSNMASGLGYENTPPTVTAQTEEVGDKIWSGKKAVLNNGVYEYESDSTSDLEYSHIKPVVGRIYNNNALASISSLYTGIPEDGLIFYAPLFSSDKSVILTNVETSKTGTITYQEYNGIPCGYFNGYSDIHQNSFDSRLAIGYSDRTVSGWMYATSNGYKWILGWGDRGPNLNGGEILGLNNSYYPVYSQQPDVSDNSTNALNKWIHVCGVVSNNIRILYVNGIYKNSGNLSRGTSSNYGLHIGSSCGVEYFVGYLSSIRVYNKALSQDEIISLASEFSI